ncbi:hypothetical protein EC973_004011 [Apophysomyces ossiformis]|uniref:Polysaccharide lyase 14 domain-containing protein n=1 Tax=Apophysomyces ossiformis TaxID=679940 RepID=A0A8H7BZU1_9FUNG|nr:hypothetical protein EC973_004011 [Apophysomyces ossiformis]
MRLLSSVVFAFASTALAQNQPLSSRAQQLGLKQTWTAPMPSSGLSGSDPVTSFVATDWDNPIGYFYGDSDVSFVSDPVTNNASSTVMKVLYASGSYSPSGTKTGKGSTGGTEFYSTPFGNQSYDSALLRYDLAFDENFPWVQGGKLPGIFGGPPGVGCSGGDQASGSNCFSVRLMWREAGAGEAYAYVPTDDNLCKQPLVMCNSDYGITISRGLINFKKKQWTTLEIYIKVNDPSQSNGILQVWQDGSLRINQNALRYRTSNAIAVSSMMFSTFFGGGTPNYATPIDTYTYYKNIEYSVGQAVTLSNNLSTRNTIAYSTWFLAGLISLLLLQ